jgi:hypothetical protein
MTTKRSQVPTIRASDLIERLAELSGNYRFYAVDFERISRDIAELAVEISRGLDAGESPTPEQLSDADAFTNFFVQGMQTEYDFVLAEKTGSKIWLVVKVLSGEYVLHNGGYLDLEDIEREQGRA